MPVKDDAEEVEGFALMPVVGRIDAHHAGNVRISVRTGDLEADAPVVGHRQQVIDRVELTIGVLRIVHTIDASAELKTQCFFIAQQLGHGQ